MSYTHNYGDLPEEYSNPEDSGTVIIPVAYDRTSTWIKGADKGPEAIIEASAHMELYDIETDSEIYKRGIFTEEPIKADKEPEEMTETVYDTVSRWLKKDKFTIVIGGEHSVSTGSIRALAEKYNDLSVLQLDAHADLRDSYSGSKYNHACVMARAKEHCPVVQAGIRSMDKSEKDSMDPSRVFFAEDIHNNTDWIQTAVSRLSQNVYITIDLDVFDPAVMPSTGTPEPGGLQWYDVLKLLRAVSDKREIAGFDVVELCPDSSNKSPDFLAAKLIYKLLSYKWKD